MSKATVEVAIALLFHRQQVLVGWREAKQHQGNKYEFPGGKVEQGEQPEQACRREVLEEVGIQLESVHLFDVIRHEYDDIHVHLHLFQAYVNDEQCEQIVVPWTWYAREQLPQLNFPKANDAIIARLNWPHQIKIGSDVNALTQLNPDQMLYLRVDDTHLNLVSEISQFEYSKLNQLILNITLWNQLDVQLQRQIGAVHFKQIQCSNLSFLQAQKTQLIGMRTIAACHDQASVSLAQQQGFDAVLLSPVLETQTHQQATALGWQGFKTIAEKTAIPIFALGGLKPELLAQAQLSGAYGIAGISQF